MAATLSARSMSSPDTQVTERTQDMGDNLVPNGLSKGLQGFLLQVELSGIVVHEARKPNAVIGI
jgi:hypothetical protein